MNIVKVSMLKSKQWLYRWKDIQRKGRKKEGKGLITNASIHIAYNEKYEI